MVEHPWVLAQDIIAIIIFFSVLAHLAEIAKEFEETCQSGATHHTVPIIARL